MSAAAPIIRFEAVSKRFAGDVVALERVDLEVHEGEFFALLGPSGCGKTTLLRMLAGFEIPSDGRILLDGHDMAGVPPNRREVNMVFQSYAVFPHMSVFDNVAYGLKVGGTPRAAIRERVDEALALVQLEGYGPRRPDQLSGGQRQRVALARALIKRPRVLLLDEPLSALDAKLREAMQSELVRLQRSVGITFVIVTHDQHEALSMADRIAVMESGRVRQVAPPDELYESPRNRFVAGFIGRMSLFTGVVTGNGDARRVVVDALGGLAAPFAGPGEGEVTVAVRPEKIRVGEPATPDGALAGLDAEVASVSYQGSVTHLELRLATGAAISASVTNVHRGERAPRPGERLRVGVDAADLVVLPE